MAAILRPERVFEPEVAPEVEYNHSIASPITYILSVRSML